MHTVRQMEVPNGRNVGPAIRRCAKQQIEAVQADCDGGRFMGANQRPYLGRCTVSAHRSRVPQSNHSGRYLSRTDLLQFSLGFCILREQKSENLSNNWENSPIFPCQFSITSIESAMANPHIQRVGRSDPFTRHNHPHSGRAIDEAQFHVRFPLFWHFGWHLSMTDISYRHLITSFYAQLCGEQHGSKH